jgi:methylated-DNA-[protein]-cysteine S-methyltransferase
METLFYSRMKSPVGPLLLGMSGAALGVLAFDPKLPERLAGRAVKWQESPKVAEPIRQQLEEYFGGRRREFTIPLDLRGTDFQKRCWKELLRIPYGETRSYAEIARAVGSPNAFRAVGQANHYNPIAIVVPCHRVLAAATTLGGYGGGLATKAFLLRLEGAEFRDDSTKDRRQQALTFT